MEQMVDWDALDAEIGDLGVDQAELRRDLLAEPSGAVLRNDFNEEYRSSHLGRDEAQERRSGSFSDEEPTTRERSTEGMGIFRDVVGDAIRPPSYQRRTYPLGRAGRVQGFPVESEPFSGLRISDREVTPAALNNILSETRFIKLPAIGTAMTSGKVGGSWATIGIVVEKGKPKLSAKGKYYAVWKLGTLEQTTVSMFLFGAAYTDFEKEPVGATFAVLNSGVRPDAKTQDPCLSVYSRDQLMKLGMSMDFALCSGKRKDGTPCTVSLNKQWQGRFCHYHATTPKIQFNSSRPELSGGKVELVGPGIHRGHPLKLPDSPVKEEIYKKPLAKVSASELQDLLSDKEKMPTKSYSQGKRFLEVMAQRPPEEPNKRRTKRGILKEAAKKAKSVPRNELNVNGTPSTLKSTADQRAHKRNSKAGTGVLEIDALDDDIDVGNFAGLL